jgi:spore maturation protein CgeB
MRILLIYPGHSHGTVDVAKGYDQALRDLGHTVRAFCYHDQLAFYSEALRHWMKVNPNFELRNPTEANLILASEQAVIEAVDFVPDVVLIVNGFALHRRAYDLLHWLRLPLALILTESPYLDEEQAKIVTLGHVGLAFTNDKISVEPLAQATGKPVYYLPHSFDPWRHHPQEPENNYRTDVFFFGTMWPERGRLLRPLARWTKRAHLEWMVRISGTRPVTNGVTQRVQLMDNEELARWYCGTKVAINHHRTIISGSSPTRPSPVVTGEGEVHIERGWSLGPRAFEIAACGAFQLCDDSRPELAEVFGESVPTYHDGADLRDKIEFYLAHDAHRRELAEESRRRVQDCTFERRVEEVVIPALKQVGG